MTEIIEIHSSPEPEEENRTLVRRALKIPGRKITRKIVIELTDSESEDVITRGSSSRTNMIQPHQSAIGPHNSLHNISDRALKRQGKYFAKQTTLSFSSDEENQPPVFFPGEYNPVGQDSERGSFELESEADLTSLFVSQVLDVIPNVDPDYVLNKVNEMISLPAPRPRKDEVVQRILHDLFENPAYPKSDIKGKRKRAADSGEDVAKKIKIDYTSKVRTTSGEVYEELAMIQLQTDFPYIPKPYVRRMLKSHNNLYAPTYLFLSAQEKLMEGNAQITPYTRKSTPFNPSSCKGKGRALQDAEFGLELAWVREVQESKDKFVAEHVNEQEYEESGEGIECGCCFSTYPFDKMVQCPEAHLFCVDCMTTYSSSLLGEHNPDIVCIHESGCKLLFPLSELRRCLSEKLISLYERVKQQKEIEQAGLENLEECPFCDWKCVIDNPDEKLFRCGNEEGGCGVISCRGCKKTDHLPKSCKEMEDDKHLDGRHTIEEAMSRALMRNCPKCQKPFVKEHGCNKITCPHCRTLSCYVCRSVIKGYDHFNQGGPATSADTVKCPLSDSIEQRHAQEVAEAGEKALAQYKLENPDVDETIVKVDLPPPPPPAPTLAHLLNPMLALYNPPHPLYNPQMPPPGEWGGAFPRPYFGQPVYPVPPPMLPQVAAHNHMPDVLGHQPRRRAVAPPRQRAPARR